MWKYFLLIIQNICFLFYKEYFNVVSFHETGSQRRDGAVGLSSNISSNKTIVAKAEPEKKTRITSDIEQYQNDQNQQFIKCNNNFEIIILIPKENTFLSQEGLRIISVYIGHNRIMNKSSMKWFH